MITGLPRLGEEYAILLKECLDSLFLSLVCVAELVQEGILIAQWLLLAWSSRICAAFMEQHCATPAQPSRPDRNYSAPAGMPA